jgi:hypothetical protein
MLKPVRVVDGESEVSAGPLYGVVDELQTRILAERSGKAGHSG